jgi:2-hydroxychromene-2-carboxylate isomerase
MDRPRVRIYTDYKSPYAFVANKRLFELEEAHAVELEWLPYTLRIPEFMGTVEERTPHFWRKVRYSYMDARRHANAQGLTMKGPRRIYDAFCSGPITTRSSAASGVMTSKSTISRPLLI